MVNDFQRTGQQLTMRLLVGDEDKNISVGVHSPDNFREAIGCCYVGDEIRVG